MTNEPSSKPIQEGIKLLVRYAPFGGSIFVLGSFIKDAQWIQATVTIFPTIATTIWAAYSQAFLERLTEIYSEEGKKGADTFKRIQDSLSEAIKWQLAATDDNYLKCQGNELTLDKTKGLNSPQLRYVFVSLELSGNFLRNSDGQNLPLLSKFSGEEERTQKILSKKGLSIWYILRQAPKDPSFRSLIIQAWGGSGKTTLLRHVTYIYTHKLHRKKAYNAPKLLPVLLYLRTWQEIIATTKELDLPTLIEDYHLPKLPQGEDLKLPPNWAENHLKKGNMLVMFDGFDEVKEGLQKKVSEWIGNCLKNYTQTVFILTSRPAAYRHYQSYESQYQPYTNLFVKPFTLEQQELFLQCWYLSKERHLSAEPDQPIIKAEADRKASSLVEQIKPKEGETNSLNDFAKNPLLLNMIVNLHSSSPDGKLPQGRADLYKSVVRLQLEELPHEREIDMLLKPDES